LQPSLPTLPSLFFKKAKYRHNHYIDSMVENHPALLTRTEIQWLLGNVQSSTGYERKIRYSINRKIATLAKLEMPLLASRGFNVTIDCNSVTAGSNARRGSRAAAGRGIANPAMEVHYIREEDGAGSGTFVPPSGSISNPRVLSDMGLAIPRPTRLGDPRPHLKQLQLTLY
jgi:hypothetical protein